jgi:formylglycine-generating enzyme required for sulfatase activity/serine/threonine protein kinase
MSQESLALPPGTLIDKLRIDRLLGQGAFGLTYLVTDTVLDKSFVLKEFLPRDLVTRLPDGRLQPVSEEAAERFSAGLARFLNEGKTVAQLEHPNIVTVFRCFEANGTAYLLMPWYRGEPLHRLLKRSGNLSEEEALALCRPLLGALEYIHRNGLVHQDIKPANVYITEEGTPILLDFGATGFGSEGYAAIEQSQPGAEVGPWTDIYSLAATLYRSVGGRIPVSAEQRKNDITEGNADPLTPLRRLVREQEYGGILAAIDQGLALESAQRPQSVGVWRNSFSMGAPVSIDKEGREWLPIILLSVFLVILAGAVIYLFVGDKPDFGEASKESPSQQADSALPPDRERHASPEETRRWQEALEADTAFAYRLFIEDFPDSIHEDQALVHLERLDHQAWGKAEFEGTRAAIESYLEQFPGGLHEADAKIALEEIRLAEQARDRELQDLERQDHEAWEAARTARTVAAIDQYLEAWPAGLHGDEARELKRQIQAAANDQRAFDAARKLNTIDAYQSYVDAFPKGNSVAQALEAIDGLTLRPGKTFRDCSDCPTMVVVPAGSFWQGSDETDSDALKMETPRRMVTFAEPFAVSVFEITLEQWDRCVADGGCSTRPRDNGWGRGSRPVIMVSWNDAQEFTSWLSQKTGQSYSLPSESQWEYAARAGEESDWLSGDAARVCEYGNIAGQESGFRWQHEDCGDQAAMETLPVGSFRPNAFGVYDVIGNVAEWTLDCMNLSYLDAPADGSAWGRGICSSRMTRGGSWFTGTREVRLPARFNLKNGDRNDFTGFRVVRTVEDQ